MRFLFFVLLIVGSILDFMGLVGFVQYGLYSLLIYLLIHLFLSVIVYLFYRYLLKDRSEIPLYLLYFLPVFGFVFTALFYFSLVVFQREGDLLENYEKYVNYVSEYILEKDIDLKKELNTSSAYDHLYIGMDQQKKNVIVDLISDDIDLKVQILKSALDDSNPEVVHYASSTLNLIEKEYEKLIEKLKIKYQQEKDGDLLREIIDVYEKYIDSGLSEGDLLNFYVDEYLLIIDECLEEFGHDFNIYVKKVKALMILKAYDRVFLVLGIMHKEYPLKAENFLYTLEVMHHMKKYKEIKNVIGKMKQLEIKVPEEYRSVIEFWS